MKYYEKYTEKKQKPSFLFSNPEKDLSIRCPYDFSIGIYLAMTGNLEETNFLQIGTHSGDSHDFLKFYIEKYGWDGMFVEPQKKLLKRVYQRYEKSSNFRFRENITENGFQYFDVAIDTEDGERFFYMPKINREAISIDFLEPLENPEKALSELSTFHGESASPPFNYLKEHKDFLSLFKKEKVDCFSIGSILEKYAFDDLNILVFDIEGYEGNIIPDLPFNTYRPEIIIFEHINVEKDSFNKVLNFLDNKSYNFFNGLHDTAAIDKKLIRQVMK